MCEAADFRSAAIRDPGYGSALSSSNTVSRYTTAASASELRDLIGLPAYTPGERLQPETLGGVGGRTPVV